jgi:hypothetical protein
LWFGDFNILNISFLLMGWRAHSILEKISTSRIYLVGFEQRGKLERISTSWLLRQMGISASRFNLPVLKDARQLERFLTS